MKYSLLCLCYKNLALLHLYHKLVQLDSYQVSWMGLWCRSSKQMSLDLHTQICYLHYTHHTSVVTDNRLPALPMEPHKLLWNHCILVRVGICLRPGWQHLFNSIQEKKPLSFLTVKNIRRKKKTCH